MNTDLGYKAYFYWSHWYTADNGKYLKQRLQGADVLKLCASGSNQLFQYAFNEPESRVYNEEQ